MPLAIKLIDGLAMILLAGASLAGVTNIASQGLQAAGWGQGSVVFAQLVYVLAGPAVLWAWRSRAGWLRVVSWIWGLGVVWNATGATIFFGGSDLRGAFTAFLAAAVIAGVTGWWIHVRVRMSA